VIPLPGRRPSPCYPRSRRLADGQGCSAALSPKGEEEIMAAPKFIEIDGKRFATFSNAAASSLPLWQKSNSPFYSS